MSKNIAQRKVERQRRLINHQRRIQHRLRDINGAPHNTPVFTASNIHYELADRVRGVDALHHRSTWRHPMRC